MNAFNSSVQMTLYKLVCLKYNEVFIAIIMSVGTCIFSSAWMLQFTDKIKGKLAGKSAQAVAQDASERHCDDGVNQILLTGSRHNFNVSEHIILGNHQLAKEVWSFNVKSNQ